jgi:hypothetical protein
MSDIKLFRRQGTAFAELIGSLPDPARQPDDE